MKTPTSDFSSGNVYISLCRALCCRSRIHLSPWNEFRWLQLIFFVSPTSGKNTTNGKKLNVPIRFFNVIDITQDVLSSRYSLWHCVCHVLGLHCSFGWSHCSVRSWMVQRHRFDMKSIFHSCFPSCWFLWLSLLSKLLTISTRAQKHTRHSCARNCPQDKQMEMKKVSWRKWNFYSCKRRLQELWKKSRARLDVI